MKLKQCPMQPLDCMSQWREATFSKGDCYMQTCTNPDCDKHIICRYILKNGKKIYPKKAKYFSFCTKKADRPVNQTA